MKITKILILLALVTGSIWLMPSLASRLWPGVEQTRQVKGESLIQIVGEEIGLPAGHFRSHPVRLEGEKCLETTVEGQGLNVGLRLVAPGGQHVTLSDIVRRSWDREWISWIANEPGLYTLEVYSPDGTAGKYFVESVRVSKAEPSSRKRIRLMNEARRHMMEANRLSVSSSPGKLHQSLELLRDASEIWTLLEEPYWQAEVLARQGIIHDTQRLPAKAIEAYSQALQHWERLEKPEMIAMVRSARGMARATTRAWPDAKVDLEEALKLLDKPGDSILHAATQTSLGACYAGSLQFEQAVSRLLEAVEEWKEAGDCYGEAQARRLLGGVYRYGLRKETLAQPQLELAEELLDSGCQPAGGAPPRNHQGWNDLGKATNLLKANDRPALTQALDILPPILEVFREEHDILGEATLLMIDGAIRVELARQSPQLRVALATQALRTMDQAQDLFRLTSNPGGELAAWALAAEANEVLGNIEVAFEQYRKAQDIAERLYDQYDPSAMPAIQLGRARLFRRLGQLKEARSAVEDALEGLELRRSTLVDSLLRASFFTQSRDYFEFYIDLLHEQYREKKQTRQVSESLKAAALHISEQARARVLRELIENRRVEPPESPEAEVLRSRQEELDAQKSLILRQLRGEEDFQIVQALEKKLARIAQQSLEMRFRIANLGPARAEAEDPAALELEGIRQLLDQDEVFLEYFLGHKTSYLFAVSLDSFQVYPLPPLEELERDVDQLWRSIKMPSFLRSNYLGSARRLYSNLIKPAASQLQGKTHLLIIPDGKLFYLPFAALLTSGNPAQLLRQDPHHWPFLVHDFDIRYAPSAGTLSSLSKPRTDRPLTSPTKLFFGIADPVGVGSEAQTAGLFPGLGFQSDDAGSPFSGLGRVLRSLGRIKPTCTQVERISQILGGQSHYLCNTDATEANLRNLALYDYRYIHFAVHGLLNQREPQYSGLILSHGSVGSASPYDPTGVPYDGIILVNELHRLKLNADLVALSACETGQGTIERGEGLIGLSRAVLYAGSPSVLVSLWKIWPDARSDPMLEFYRHLKDFPAEKAEALRAAQIHMINNGYAHPFYWAPFILIGEG